MITTTTEERAWLALEARRDAHAIRSDLYTVGAVIARLLAERDALEHELRDTSHTCNALEQRATAAEAAHDQLARDVGQALIVMTLAEGEQLAEPSRHAIVGAMLTMRARAVAAEANYRFMVERAADERLDGYRELGAMAAQNAADRDAARAEVARLRGALEQIAQRDLVMSPLPYGAKLAREALAKGGT